MKVGHIIKNERMRQGMKQVVLAKGICTSSYLSRIEQEIIIPSEEIVLLLLKKLNLDISKIRKSTFEEDASFSEYLNSIYKDVIINKNKLTTQQRLEELQNINYLFESQALYYTYLLVLLRLRLIIGEDFTEIKLELQYLNGLSSNFNPQQIYLLSINNAIYSYLISNYKEAIHYFEQAQSIDLKLEDWEQAELNYMIALTYITNDQTTISVHYLNKALDYFKDHFCMDRVIDCHLLIGITYKKNGHFNEALNHYLKAKEISEKFNLGDDHFGIIHHNLGSLSISMGNREEGIRHFYKSLEYKNGKSKLITILGLVIEYSKMKNTKLIIKWCNEGLQLLNDLVDESLISYEHHFTFYKSLYQADDSSIFAAENAIKYFFETQNYYYANKYSIALAEWYFSQKKYKLSAQYYSEANQYIFKDKSIISWEDL
ncbi:helix-turn-helix transcriptional regulator [Lysinibacillus sp. 54212]|uniref:helix-turn-helix transcriptional regulator n=1 Tax=Lysinibacillus sp. 54212 TaxID=3119829 RepID=UPI002FCA409B